MMERIKEAINVIKENDRGGFTIPTKQLYPHQWNWDSGFTALGISSLDKTRAWQELIMLINAQWTNGMVPHIIFHENNPNYFPGPEQWQKNTNSQTSCHSQPPILASIIWRMVTNGSEFDKMKAGTLFKSIIAYHRWFFLARDPHNEGFLSIIHPWESGRDNSTDWDTALSNINVPQNLEKYFRKDITYVDGLERPSNDHYDRFMTILKFGRNSNWNSIKMYHQGPFLAIDPGVNFIFLRANKDLYKLANYLGYFEYLDEIKNWIEVLQQGCQIMWNDHLNAFSSYDRRGNTYCNAITNASFLCFYAGVGSKRQKLYMIDHCKRILDNCTYGIPSLDPMHKYFESKRYWRGPVWSIMNYMIAIGLEEINEIELAHKIKNDTVQLVITNGMAEYFDPITGEGLGGKDFSWTAAIHLELLKNKIDMSLKNDFIKKKNVLN